MGFVDGEPSFLAKVAIQILDWIDVHVRKRKPKKADKKLITFLERKGFYFEKGEKD